MKKALVVGINNYPGAPLEGCENDATSIGTILETNGDGSPNFSVIYRTDITKKGELKKILSDLFSGDCETALFYFSGHGFINELGGYIVTPDFEEYDEGISMTEILAMANKSKIKDKVIILDCCHGGSIGDIDKSNTCIIGEGLSILTACRKDEEAIEVNGRGIFTNLLIDALQGGAADLKGHISPGAVYAYIDQALGPWDQRPVFKTNVTRFTTLRMVNAQVPLEDLRKIIDFFPTPQTEFQLDPSFEDTNSKDVKHEIVEPYANPVNTSIFKCLQKYQSVGLVVPVGEQYMYFAAMHSKSCRLTALGYHYWRLIKEKRM